MGYPQILPKSPEYKYISCLISATPKRQKYVSMFLCLWGCYLGVHPNEGYILGVCLTYSWLMNHIIYGYGLLQSEKSPANAMENASIFQSRAPSHGF